MSHGARFSHSHSEALPDFVKLAEAFGCVGLRAESPDELDAKVADSGEKRVEALRITGSFRVRPVDTTHTSFVFEITGAPAKIDNFPDLMGPLGLVDVSRTGVAAISRGAEAM